MGAIFHIYCFFSEMSFWTANHLFRPMVVFSQQKIGQISSERKASFSLAKMKMLPWWYLDGLVSLAWLLGVLFSLPLLALLNCSLAFFTYFHFLLYESALFFKFPQKYPSVSWNAHKKESGSRLHKEKRDHVKYWQICSHPFVIMYNVAVQNNTYFQNKDKSLLLKWFCEVHPM